VAAAARQSAQELITELPLRMRAFQQLVQELAALWKDPVGRMASVASTDITLMDEINGVG
jgi:hypothetical protein